MFNVKQSLFSFWTSQTKEPRWHFIECVCAGGVEVSSSPKLELKHRFVCLPFWDEVIHVCHSDVLENNCTSLPVLQS